MKYRFRMTEPIECIFAAEKMRDKQNLDFMENSLKKDIMVKTKKCLGAMLDTFRGSTLPLVETILFVAALLYFRKHNALSVVGDRIYLDENLIDKEQNSEFKLLLDNTISKLRTYESYPAVINFVKTINEILFSEEELLDLLSDAQEQLTFSGLLGEMFQPRELSELVKLLLNKQTKNIFDPFGGYMNFATTLKDKNFVAYEINSTTRNVALFRMALAGVLDHCIIADKSAEEWIGNTRFHAIVTFPPYGLKLRMKDTGKESVENSELVALSRFESSTTEDGELITILPQSFLSSEQKKVQNLRKHITQSNWLDTIICLPKNIFPFSSIAPVVIVLKKQRREDAPIKLIDASMCFFQTKKQYRTINVEAIKQLLSDKKIEYTREDLLNQQALWDVQWFLDRKNTVFSEGYSVVELSDVIAPIQPCRHFDDITGRVANVSSLPSKFYDFEKAVDEFPESSNLKGTSKISEPALLLSLIGSSKPTFCNASAEAPIFIKSDVCAYRIVNKTVHIGYLCLELSKRLKANKGAVIPRLSKNLILKTQIEFPSLNSERSLIEQRNIFEEARLTAEIGKINEQKLETLLEKRKKEYIEEIRHRKHDMKTPMAQLRNTLTLLEKLSDQISGEPSDKLKLYVQRQTKAMNILSNIVEHIADENAFSSPEPIDLGKMLSSFQTKTEKYIVAYYPNKAILSEAGISKPMVMMGKTELERLVQNIIDNAVEHGFVEDQSEYSINIALKIEDGYFFVDFSNNGRPLPEGMTKDRYALLGEKGKDSKGNGRGGHIVKSIVEHYGGDYDVYSECFAGNWFTHVIVKLPIYQDNE